jgi:hypothetical protein
MKRLFRIHRSTAVLMFALLLLFGGANLYRHPAPPKLSGIACGFPFPMFKNWQPISKPNTVATVDETYVTYGRYTFHFQNNWCYALLWINVLICGVITLTVGLIWELWIRRRMPVA